MTEENTFLALQDEPSKLLELICSSVASGGSLVSLAELWQFPYHQILKWLRSDSTRLDRYHSAVRDREEWSKDKILHELRVLSSFTLVDILDEDDRLLPVSEWPKDLAKCVEGFDMVEATDKDGNVTHIIKKVKLTPKIKALEMMMKNLGLLTPVIKLEASETLEALLAGTWNKDD